MCPWGWIAIGAAAATLIILTWAWCAAAGQADDAMDRWSSRHHDG